jgi:hypothetical protein
VSADILVRTFFNIYRRRTRMSALRDAPNGDAVANQHSIAGLHFRNQMKGHRTQRPAHADFAQARTLVGVNGYNFPVN